MHFYPILSLRDEVRTNFLLHLSYRRFRCDQFVISSVFLGEFCVVYFICFASCIANKTDEQFRLFDLLTSEFCIATCRVLEDAVSYYVDLNSEQHRQAWILVLYLILDWANSFSNAQVGCLCFSVAFLHKKLTSHMQAE